MPPGQPLGTKPRALPGWCWDLRVWALGRSSGVHSRAWQGRLPEPELWGAVSPWGGGHNKASGGGPVGSPPHTGLGSRLAPASLLSPGPNLWEALRAAASRILGQRPPGAPRGSEASWKPLWPEQLHKANEARPRVRGPAGSPFCPVVGQQGELPVGSSMDPLEGWRGASAPCPSPPQPGAPLSPQPRRQGKGPVPRRHGPLSESGPRL